MPLLPRLEAEIAELRKRFNVDVYEEAGIANLVFVEFPLGPGFNVQTADLLVRVPLSYPDSGPDMFWTDPVVLLANGTEPQAANAMENYAGRRWRRFSWHHNRWDSLRDSLGGYVEFIRHRLEQKK